MNGEARMPAGVTHLYWFNTTVAALTWPLGIWLAVTRDWTYVFGPVLLSVMVGLMWFAYHVVKQRRIVLHGGQPIDP